MVDQFVYNATSNDAMVIADFHTLYFFTNKRLTVMKSSFEFQVLKCHENGHCKHWHKNTNITKFTSNIWLSEIYFYVVLITRVFSAWNCYPSHLQRPQNKILRWGAGASYTETQQLLTSQIKYGCSSWVFVLWFF